MLVAVAKHDHVLSSLEAQHLLSTIHRYRKMRLKPNTPSTQPRRLVGYPRAVLDRPNLLVDHPRGTPMPSIAIYGDSGMAKTMIIKRFRDQHPPSFNSLTGRLKTPVLAMEMTSRPGERRWFYAELLTSRRTTAAARRYRPNGASCVAHHGNHSSKPLSWLADHLSALWYPPSEHWRV